MSDQGPGLTAARVARIRHAIDCACSGQQTRPTRCTCGLAELVTAWERLAAVDAVLTAARAFNGSMTTTLNLHAALAALDRPRVAS